MSLSLSGLQRALWVTSLDELSSYLKLDDLNPSNYVCAALWKFWHWNAVAHTLKCL